jgi:hypothetical protein
MYRAAAIRLRTREHRGGASHKATFMKVDVDKANLKGTMLTHVQNAFGDGITVTRYASPRIRTQNADIPA